MGFVAEQLTRLRAAWKEMLDHPFLLRTRDGAIPLDVAPRAERDRPRVALVPFRGELGGAAFAGYVAQLEQELDELAAHAGATERARMAELFELTLRYEVAFWEMAWTAAGWPRASVPRT